MCVRSQNLHLGPYAAQDPKDKLDVIFRGNAAFMYGIFILKKAYPPYNDSRICGRFLFFARGSSKSCKWDN